MDSKKKNDFRADDYEAVILENETLKKRVEELENKAIFVFQPLGIKYKNRQELMTYFYDLAAQHYGYQDMSEAAQQIDDSSQVAELGKLLFRIALDAQGDMLRDINQDKQVKKIAMRLLAFPFFAAMSAVFIVGHLIKHCYLFVVYGGESIVYQDKNEGSTIRDVYIKLNDIIVKSKNP